MPILRSVGLRYRGAVSGGGGSFSPDDIAGLQLWLDADDASTITESSGAVSQWDDKSGNGHHATQGTASRQPTTGTRTINGKNALDFQGSASGVSGDAMAATIASIPQAFTLFVVAKSDTLDGDDGSSGRNRYLIDTSNRTILGARFESLGTTMPWWQYAGTGQDGPDIDLSAHIVSAVYDGASSALRIDAASTPTSPGANATGTTLAVGSKYDHSENFWDGLIAEVLAYDSALSSSEISDVEAYLESKWGVTLP